MKQDVSKKTVRFLSEQTTGSVSSDVTPPSNSFFIKQIKNKYAALIAQAEINMQASKEESAINKFRQQKEKHKAKLDRFKQALSEIPDEFSLAPTMYTRITGEQNKKIAKEFSTYSRSRFMIYLAENHTEDLKKVGLCENSIKRMKSGLDPADKEGRFYNLTVDHIIERSGSGEFGYDKSYDRKTGQYMRPTYKVNHFANLVLMPSDIHSGIKNVINDIQELPLMEAGQAKWSISLVPTGNNLAECSIYVPKTPKDASHFIHKHKRKTKTKISNIMYLAKQLDVEAKLYLEFSEMGVKGEKDIATQNIQKSSLAKAFNGKEQSEYIYNRRIEPLLQEMTDILYSIDKDLSTLKRKGKDKDIKYLTEQLSKTLGSTFLKITETIVQDVAKFSGEKTGLAFKRKRHSLLDKYCRAPKPHHHKNNHK